MQERRAPGAERAAAWRRYLRFWGARPEDDVDDELHFHVEMRVRDYMARGMSEAQARTATARRLGDYDAARAECVTVTTRRYRRMARAQLVDALWQDLAFALRTLGRQKGWTAVAILTLALGIGANTAVFSVVDSLLLHPLAYPDANRVALIVKTITASSADLVMTVTPSPAELQAWRAHSHSFEDIEPYVSADMTLLPHAVGGAGGSASAPASGASGGARVVHVASVLASFPAFTGEHPVLGRSFTASEVAHGAPVAMLGESLWRGRYGSDPHVLGSVITLNGTPYTIIGVMPAAFRLPNLIESPKDVWLPLDLTHSDVFEGSAVGRLRPGVTRAAAARELSALSAHLAEAGKAAQGSSFHPKLNVVAPSEFLSFHKTLSLFVMAAGFVLLIACANMAHLLLARAASREREMALRVALGAGRARLFRQLATESLVLSAAGCAGALVVGWLGLDALIAIRPPALAALAAAHLNTAALLVTIALAVVTGVLFGVFGAVQSSRYSTHDALKAGALSTSQSRRHGRMRSLLVVSEMALSATLLVGAALLVRSIVHLEFLDPGFNVSGLYSVHLALPPEQSNKPAGSEFVAEVEARARALPGVTGVGVTSTTPSFSMFDFGALQREGDPLPPADASSPIDINQTDANYFRLAGVRLVQGTTFSDTSATSSQMIINEGLARKYWPGAPALGHRIRIVSDGKGTWRTIVGVAADAALHGPTEDRSTPLLYLPWSASSGAQPVILVRAAPGLNVAPALRALVASMNPALPPADIENVADAMSDGLAFPRFEMTLLGAFTAVALLLAAVGLYGVMAYAVAQRTREIGIRMALGASRQSVARAVVRQGTILALCGAVVGLVAAHWAMKLVAHMLYGVTVSDPLSYAVAGVALLATALVACIVPARRAVAVDPLIAMRAD